MLCKRIKHVALILAYIERFFEDISSVFALFYSGIMSRSDRIKSALKSQFEKLLKFDFSVVNDFNYYDGVIFKGFINSIPDSILSGGRYDKLLMKMGKNVGAIGFAVYLDRLERFGNEEAEYDADVLLVYDENADIEAVIETVKRFNENGKTVRVSATDDKSIRYKRLVKVSEGGMQL